MINRKWSGSAALGLATLLLSLNSYAQFSTADTSRTGEDTANAGFLLGAQLGYVNTHWDDINQNAFANSTVVVQDPDGAGARVYVGYAFSQYVGFEIGYTYLGTADIARWNQASFQNFPQTKITTWAVDASSRFSVPIYKTAGVFATIGVTWLVSDDTIPWQTNNLQPVGEPPVTVGMHVATYQATYGFGAYRDIDCHLRLEVVWKHFQGSSATDDVYQPDPDFYAVGFVYRI